MFFLACLFALACSANDDSPRLRSVATLCRNFCAKGDAQDFPSCLRRCLASVAKPLPAMASRKGDEGGAEQESEPEVELGNKSVLQAVDEQCRALCKRDHASKAMFRTCVTACDVEADAKLPGQEFSNAPPAEDVEKVLAFEQREEERNEAREKARQRAALLKRTIQQKQRELAHLVRKHRLQNTETH